jgi:UDP-N-acetylglucosamine 2-epimerase
VKAAAVSRVLRRSHQERLVHTGQHYDDKMSAIFFNELDIPKPDYNLNVGSGNHGEQTGAMLMGIERILIHEKPDRLLVYGDTNSTMAGALAAAKLGIPVVHVEAGLRSFVRDMPEEINRVVADHLSGLLLCPSQAAVDNLAKEGLTRGVHLVGDVMTDALAFASDRAASRSRIMEDLGLKKDSYLLVTVHRAENTDAPGRLEGIMSALADLVKRESVVFPIHPRTRKALAGLKVNIPSGVRAIDPVGYLDMVMLEKSARMILTDSGGIQKEAYWMNVPCVILRDETEWVEMVATGWNMLAGTDPERITSAVKSFVQPPSYPSLYGDGHAAERCVKALE